MGGFSESIVGLKELDEKLSAMATTEAHKVIHDALLEGGKVLQAAIAERAPERPVLPSGTALPPGALKRDIEIHFGKDPDGLPAAIVVPGKYTEHAARWVEYGHRLVRGGYSRLIKKGRNAGKYRGPGQEVGEVPEHPFIREGYEAARQPAVEVTCQAIAEGIEKAAAKK